MSNRRPQESRRPWAWLIFDVRQKMSRRTIVVSAFALLAGCAVTSREPTREEALRATLDPAFAATSVPTGKEDDFYAIVRAFRTAMAGMRVRRVSFTSDISATLWFYDPAHPREHGDDEVYFAKKDRRWTMAEEIGLAL